MSWEPVGFMFFSTIEGIGLLALMLSVFRLKITQFMWPALFTILIMNFQSYMLRNELSLSYLVPVINIFLFITFITIFVKESILGSAIITVTGYLVFSILQASLLVLIFGSIGTVESSTINGYILQTLSFMLDTVLAWFLYRHGKGFSFDFEKLKIKKEIFIVVGCIAATIILFAVLMYQENISKLSAFFILSLFYFLYYSIKKERADD
ncbi:hypothetical protein [Paenibacillus sp. P32E]|uniref:hypothetical protein n=1 Tax=Paenibacillus sp. P32E TaxID=1349434 RepID=UPI00096291B2|nr:hypothetical protein [Paenibacillus sp. P32E]OKP91361.1 hypothetical protein A3848_09650 [Paenibacillus sp. P32E]